ncbi:MAG: SDR family oxidoreductase [Patescibacteria group bacterium]
MGQKRTAIISGGLGGVGRAIGKQLALDGYDIIALYLNTPPEEAKTAIQEFTPGNHEAIRCDIRDAYKVRSVISQLSETHKITVAIHTAVDPILRKNLLELNGNEFNGQFATGVFGGFNFLKTVALTMKKDGGNIIGILSRPLQFNIPHPRMGGYIVVKHALRGLLKELSEELIPFHIAVNAVAPDFLNTTLNADLPKEVRKFIEERAVTGSIRSPEDVAHVVSFLCSEKGKGINSKIFSFNKKEVTNL